MAEGTLGTVFYSVRMRASRGNRHISGAEGLFVAGQTSLVARRFADRAMNHERGRPEKVVVTIEELKEQPEQITALPVCTVKNNRPSSGAKIVRELLLALGISEQGIESAMDGLQKAGHLGGAIIMNTEGVRTDPDLGRGVRVSRMGISPRAGTKLARMLSRRGINSQTVREALILASKVNWHPGIIGEFCISDDPGYTTGYVASKRFGYVRVPQIKRKGEAWGGRVFFMYGTDTKPIVSYLETRPVMVTEVLQCEGFRTIRDILNPAHAMLVPVATDRI